MLFQTKSRGGLRTVGNVLTRSTRLIGSGGVFALSDVASALWQELFTDAANDLGFSNTRATTQYVETDTGNLFHVPAGAIPIRGARPAYNLVVGGDTPSTQNITVVVGHVYAVRIGSESASGATAVCSGAFTGTLTGDGADSYALNGVATTTTLTVTITGSIRKLQVQDITHRAFNNLGADVVTNGTFDTDTDWTKGTGWTIGSGVLTSDGTSGNASQELYAEDKEGALFLVQFNTSGGAYSGNLNIRLGNQSTTLASVSADGVHTFVLVATSSPTCILTFRVGNIGDFIGSIDNVTVRPLADADLVPDEYVDSATDHGTGVNGFRYFTTALANTVDGSGVVTEGTGAALTGIALANVPGATNFDQRSTPKTADYTTKVGLTISDNADAGPFGDGSAALITGTGSGGYAQKGAANVSYAAGTSYCFWQLVKPGTSSWHRMTLPYSAFGTSSDRQAWFNLSGSGSVGTTQAKIDSAGIRLLECGYYLCWITSEAVSTESRPPGYISVADADGSVDSSGTVYLAHNQVVVGTLPTAAIRTSGSTASTDAAVLDFSGVTGFTTPNETRIVATGLGPNLVNDAYFNDSDNWSFDAGFSHSGDTVIGTSVPVNNDASLNNIFTAGKQYLVIFHAEITAGHLFLRQPFNGSVDYGFLQASGSYFATGVAGGTALNIRAYNATTTCVITGVDIFEIDPTSDVETIIDVDNWDGTDISDILPHANVISVTQYAPGERP